MTQDPKSSEVISGTLSLVNCLHAESFGENTQSALFFSSISTSDAGLAARDGGKISAEVAEERYLQRVRLPSRRALPVPTVNCILQDMTCVKCRTPCSIQSSREKRRSQSTNGSPRCLAGMVSD